MARAGGRTRRREGAGIGERLSEIVIFLIIAAGLFWLGRWYFVVYKNSPTVALVEYVGAVKAGNLDGQFRLLSSKTKQTYPDKDKYAAGWKMAQGLAGRMGDFTVNNMTESGDRAEADVSVSIRKAGDSLLNVAADSFTDHYVLRRESDGWKVALDECYDKIKSRGAAAQ